MTNNNSYLNSCNVHVVESQVDSSCDRYSKDQIEIALPRAVKQLLHCNGSSQCLPFRVYRCLANLCNSIEYLIYGCPIFRPNTANNCIAVVLAYSKRGSQTIWVCPKASSGLDLIETMMHELLHRCDFHRHMHHPKANPKATCNFAYDHSDPDARLDPDTQRSGNEAFAEVCMRTCLGVANNSYTLIDDPSANPPENGSSYSYCCRCRLCYG